MKPVYIRPEGGESSTRRVKPVYIPPEGGESNRRVTCYVCGCRKSAEFPLAIRQQASGPYFPFLETHEQPDGADPPTQDGRILACFLCYSCLTKQWELYERDKVPPVKRIYWLKRVDQGPYTGVEEGVQGEYASQLLGLTPDPPVPPVVKRPVPSTSSTSARVVHPPTQIVTATPTTIHETKRQRILPPQAQPPTVPLPPPGVLPLPVQLPVPQTHPQQEALDLTVDRRRNHGIKRPSPDQPQQSEGLDLSMPDKNATTEVCYICGDQHEKGTLVDIYAKQQLGGCPFFPSLTNHSRPSKSHPMEASGRVQGCTECYNHLKCQWDAYEVHNIPHEGRNYSLRKRNSSLPSSSRDSTAFICYKCGSEFPSSKLCLIYCRSNCEKEPFYPLIQNIVPPEGASPISPQGMVQVCTLCSKAIPQEQARLDEKATDINKTFSSEVKPLKSDGFNSRHQQTDSPQGSSSQHNSIIMAHPLSESLVEEVSCYLCHQSHHRQMMHWLSMVSDKNTSNGMYFCFLKFLPRMSSNTVIEDGKVLACHPCYQHLSTQWEEFEKDNVPTDQRQFSLRSMPMTSQSPRLTPGSRRGSPDILTAAESGNPQGFANAIKMNENSTRKNSVTTGYLGQPLHTLEVVPATPDSNTPVLPVITTQHALNLAINCFVCSFYSKHGQTYALRSKAQGTDPFFPFLAKHQSAHPEARVDANCVLVCLYCFHSLILQWQQYEKEQVDHNARLYDTYNYSCFICSLKTYRKRLYLLAVKDFPFLKEHNRPTGGMVVDNGHSVVVCKDCYSSLDTQYFDLERLGVPVERRQYNWIQRPPPPEFQQELPASSGSKPTSQGATLPLVMAGAAGASSPSSHLGMSPEPLSQSSVTGRAPASRRVSQSSIAKSPSAPVGNTIDLRSPTPKAIEEAPAAASSFNAKITTTVGSPEAPSITITPFSIASLQRENGIARKGGNWFESHAKRHSVALREVKDSGDATIKGFSGNGITAMDQYAKNVCLKRRFLPQPRECVSPEEKQPSSISRSLDKDKEKGLLKGCHTSLGTVQPGLSDITESGEPQLQHLPLAICQHCPSNTDTNLPRVTPHTCMAKPFKAQKLQIQIDQGAPRYKDQAAVHAWYQQHKNYRRNAHRMMTKRPSLPFDRYGFARYSRALLILQISTAFP